MGIADLFWAMLGQKSKRQDGGRDGETDDEAHSRWPRVVFGYNEASSTSTAMGQQWELPEPHQPNAGWELDSVAEFVKQVSLNSPNKPFTALGDEKDLASVRYPGGTEMINPSTDNQWMLGNIEMPERDVKRSSQESSDQTGSDDSEEVDEESEDSQSGDQERSYTTSTTKSSASGDEGKDTTDDEDEDKDDDEDDTEGTGATTDASEAGRYAGEDQEKNTSTSSSSSSPFEGDGEEFVDTQANVRKWLKEMEDFSQSVMSGNEMDIPGMAKGTCPPRSCKSDITNAILKKKDYVESGRSTFSAPGDIFIRENAQLQMLSAKENEELRVVAKKPSFYEKILEAVVGSCRNNAAARKIKMSMKSTTGGGA